MRSGGFFWINSPLYFQKPFQVISSVLDPETRKKIFVLGGPDSYQQILDYAFAKEDLPIMWGGKLEGNHISNLDNPRTPFFDAVQAHCEKVVRAKDSKYCTNHRKNVLKSVKLKPQEKHQVEVEVEASQVVEWQLHAESHEIEYSVYLKKKGAVQLDTVRKPSKISALVPRINGKYIHADPEAARLVFDFGNTKSRFKTRTLSYRFMVLEKDGTE